MKITTALISVSDKTGIIEFGHFLNSNGIKILSTGGTSKTLKSNGVIVEEISEYTRFPEILDGRVKTLDPKIHGGILARRDKPDHLKTLDEYNIMPIDLVIVNLYPFKRTVADNADHETCIKNIDVGGFTLIRSAAKNYNSVTVVINPNHYENIMNEIKEKNGETNLDLRRQLAAEAYKYTSAYDDAIFTWFNYG